MAILGYMLDTNVISDLVRQPNGSVARRLTALEKGAFGITVIVAAELRCGAERSESRRLRRQLDTTALSAIRTVSMEEPVDQHCGMIRTELERKGQSIGMNDLLIAAHARALGATLVTNNTRALCRVADLKIEDWR